MMPLANKKNLISQSIRLDKNFLSLSFLDPIEKAEFIFAKYRILIKHILLNKAPVLGKNKIKIFNQRLYYDSSFGLSNYQAMMVNIQNNFLEYLIHLKKPTIIDIGAHLGYFSLTLARIFPNAKIYACEPVSEAFRLMQKNCKNFQNITPIHTGFANDQKTQKIYYAKSLLMYSSLYKQRFLWKKKPSTEIVQLTTLDSFTKLHNIGKIQILKIDAEGAEESILQGGAGALQNTLYLIIECPLDQVAGTTFSSLLSKLYTPQYNFQLINFGPIQRSPGGRLETVDLLLKNIAQKHDQK